MKGLTSENLVKIALKEFEAKVSNTLLVIDGETMGLIFSDKELEEKFF
jgi:hypothetical protein